MKSLMLCITIAAFSASLFEASIELPSYCDDYSPQHCNKILWPVCASTGVTYDNLCLMCSAIMNGHVPADATYHQGACPGRGNYWYWPRPRRPPRH